YLEDYMLHFSVTLLCLSVTIQPFFKQDDDGEKPFIYFSANTCLSFLLGLLPLIFL
ncbi:MAG: hypothetical protein C5S41_02860, partial [Candidatus Methanomarinus sp.]